MADDREMEDLDHLVSSPGWARLAAMVEQTYGRGSERFFKAVTDAAAATNPHAAEHLRQIIAEQRGAFEALALATNRLKQLKQVSEPRPIEYSGSRRGGL